MSNGASVKTIDLFGRKFTNKYAQAMRQLTPEERRDLVASIKNRGILKPVFHDEDDNIIDGWNRMEIASELRLADVPLKPLYGLSELEKERLAVILNITGRLLTVEEKTLLIETVLKRDPNKSSRKVAEETKTTPSKVEEVRKTLEEKNEVPVVKEREAGDGGKAPEKPKEKKPKPTGPATQTNGDVTTVPNHLADAFKEADRMALMASTCRSAANWFKTSVQPWNKWASIAELHDLYTRLAKLIEDCTPHAVCPKCKGYACKECRMTGWVPKWKEEELEHEAAGKRT